MIWLFEAAGMLALAGVVWIMFRAARARPDQRGLVFAAVLALVLWFAFGLLLLVDAGAFDDPLRLAWNALIAALILAVVMGYRRVLAILRERSGGK